MINADRQPPALYTHIKSGKIYKLLMIANQHSDRPEFPPTAIYHGEDGHLWSRPLDEFKAKFNEHRDPTRPTGRAFGGSAK